MRFKPATLLLAIGGLLAVSAAGYARRPAPSSKPGQVWTGEQARARRPLVARSAPASAFTRLAPLEIRNVNTQETLLLKLYDARGQIDESAAERLDQLLCDARKPGQRDTSRIDRRSLQLMFKASYHFGGANVEIISGFRKPGRHREGLHATGRAIDFKLEGVPAATLASYLRTLPKVGVGVYTHPRTQYVHLDTREQSYHWLDASPPRRTWRERSLGPIPPAHDAAYTPEGDWPDGLDG